MSIYFPKRDELSLRIVRALPKLSNMGLESKTCCSTRDDVVDGVASEVVSCSATNLDSMAK
eukprot:scaffold29477_cov23-Cyclotella_meneghiniana.AAC.1